MKTTAPLEVPGFRAAGLPCGIKQGGAPDLALIACDRPASAAGLFTRSTVVGAPVEWNRRHIGRGRARAVVVNSGVSNVGLGARGLRDAAGMASATARQLGCAPEEVLVASTGVIGQPLPMAVVRRGIERAAGQLAPGGLVAASTAILTTDTVAKRAAVQTRIGRRQVSVSGIAKGSGMIEPDMATMLAFVLTDADVSPPQLRRVLRRVGDATFNRLSVDGETSTSDSVILLAGGAAGNPRITRDGDADARRLEAALLEVCEQLVRQLARDGEGATRLITVEVTGARTAAEADRAARRIANSLLVKTAIFGGDPNWGRILQTVGAGRVALEPGRARIDLAGVTVFARGRARGPEARRRAEKALAAEEIPIRVDLASGRFSARMWTCDLSYDYVRINAEYTT